MTPFLDADVMVRRPGHTLTARLTAERGEVLAVIGPNGAGKSTLLRALAGLVPLHRGAIVCGGVRWDDPTRRPLRVQQRAIGMVFQDRLLFPHLSALDNVAFGPRSRGAGRAASREIASHWLERVGVGPLASRRASRLSGGQAQRVAIARALATDPSLLLLDEPMAALDVGVATALRLDLARHLTGFAGATVLVTHDPVDAMTLANRVVVLDEGRVAQVGSPEEVSRAPRTEHVARLVGLNVIRGHSTGTDIRLPDGSRLATTTAFNGEVLACFGPNAVTLALEEPTGSARNQWRATVRTAVPHGAAVRVHLGIGHHPPEHPSGHEPVGPAEPAFALFADVTPASAAGLGLVPGRRVWAMVKATEVRVDGASTFGAGGQPDAPLPSRYV